MTTIEDRLSRHLEAVAPYVETEAPDSGAATIIRSARRRQFRRRRLATTACGMILLGAVVAGGLAMTSSRRRGELHVVSPAGVNDPVAEESQATTGPTAVDPADPPAAQTLSTGGNSPEIPAGDDLVWVRHDGVQAVTGARIRASDGGFYGVGTVPVTGGFTAAVFSSQDGIDWKRAPDLDDRISDIRNHTWDTPGGGSPLYSVGTIPVSGSAAGQLAVVSYNDNERVVHQVLSEPDFPALNAIAKIHTYQGPGVRGPMGTLLSAFVGPAPDSANPAASVVPPADLGRFALGDAVLYYAADNEHFDSVALPPGGPAARDVAAMFASTNGFVVVTRNGPVYGGKTTELTLYSSPNGRVWSPGPSTEISGDVSSSGEVDGRMVVVVRRGPITEVVSTDGLTWEHNQIISANLPDDPMAAAQTPGEPYVLSLAPDGIAIQVAAHYDYFAAVGGAQFHMGGYTFRSESFGGIVSIVEDSTGAVISSDIGKSSDRVMYYPDGTISIVDTAGQSSLRLSSEQIMTELMADAASRGAPKDGAECYCTVYQSATGRSSWRAIDVRHVVGEPVASVRGIGPTAKGFAMTVVLVRRAPDGQRITLVFEATPP